MFGKKCFIQLCRSEFGRDNWKSSTNEKKKNNNHNIHIDTLTSDETTLERESQSTTKSLLGQAPFTYDNIVVSTHRSVSMTCFTRGWSVSACLVTIHNDQKSINRKTKLNIRIISTNARSVFVSIIVPVVRSCCC